MVTWSMTFYNRNPALEPLTSAAESSGAEFIVAGFDGLTEYLALFSKSGFGDGLENDLGAEWSLLDCTAIDDWLSAAE
jgi:hypothetical protein